MRGATRKQVGISSFDIDEAGHSQAAALLRADQNRRQRKHRNRL